MVRRESDRPARRIARPGQGSTASTSRDSPGGDVELSTRSRRRPAGRRGRRRPRRRAAGWRAGAPPASLRRRPGRPRSPPPARSAAKDWPSTSGAFRRHRQLLHLGDAALLAQELPRRVDLERPQAPPSGRAPARSGRRRSRGGSAGRARPGWTRFRHLERHVVGKRRARPPAPAGRRGRGAAGSGPRPSRSSWVPLGTPRARARRRRATARPRRLR